MLILIIHRPGSHDLAQRYRINLAVDTIDNRTIIITPCRNHGQTRCGYRHHDHM